MASRSLNGVEIRVVDDPAREAAGFLIEHAAAGGHIAVSGGSAPGPAYRLAAQHHPDWTGAHVWFGDDRVVPPDDDRSNYRLVRTTLLDALSRSPEVHRIRGERPPEEAAALYHDELEGITLDLALNGIGPDGHTASLFPASPALGDRERRAVAVEAALEPYVPRVTMTPKVFTETRVLLYLVAGESKAAAVKAAFADEPSLATPASGIRGRTTIAILDAAAASLLPPG
ncbi:MAG TPA: 6-phosphogluconolactonase [Gaiellaceae bacterium]|nr:6-phosphogluconolactonase [Gaiellaceae bacterium]